MANMKAAIKYIKITARNRARNLGYRNRIKKLIKTFRAKPDQAALKPVISLLDKAALKGIIHKNKAARKKSQLTRLLSK